MPLCLAVLVAAGLAATSAACGVLNCLACLISSHGTIHEDER